MKLLITFIVTYLLSFSLLAGDGGTGGGGPKVEHLTIETNFFIKIPLNNILDIELSSNEIFDIQQVKEEIRKIKGVSIDSSGKNLIISSSSSIMSILLDSGDIKLL